MLGTFQMGVIAAAVKIAAPDGAFSFYRVRTTANDGDGTYISFGELELFASSDGTGTDLTTGRSSFATQNGDGAVGAASAGCDNSDNSECGSSGAGALGESFPYIWQVQLASASVVRSMSLQSQRVVTGRTPRTFKLQGSTSSTGPWTDIITVANSASWGVLERRVFSAS
jgi:hypothetical protein